MKDNNSPLVSIIIPAYNAEKTIERAVKSALNQDYNNVEVLVVDDFSTDKTIEMLDAFKDHIKLIKHKKNKNGAAARNTGARCASGNYLAFLDSDDVFLPCKIKKQLNYIEEVEKGAGVNVEATLCSSYLSDEKVMLEVVSPRQLFLREVDENSSCILIKKTCWQSLGGFDESFARHQDLEFLIRLASTVRLYYQKEVLVSRIFSGSPSFVATKSGIYHFWAKFDNTIKSMSKKDRRFIYGYGYRRLAELAFNEKDFLNFIFYFLKALIESPSLVFNKIGYYIEKKGLK